MRKLPILHLVTVLVFLTAACIENEPTLEQDTPTPIGTYTRAPEFSLPSETGSVDDAQSEQTPEPGEDEPEAVASPTAVATPTMEETPAGGSETDATEEPDRATPESEQDGTAEAGDEESADAIQAAETPPTDAATDEPASDETQEAEEDAAERAGSEETPAVTPTDEVTPDATGVTTETFVITETIVMTETDVMTETESIIETESGPDDGGAEEQEPDATAETTAVVTNTLGGMSNAEIYEGLPEAVAAYFPEEADAEEGEQLVSARGCVACHSLEEGVVQLGPSWYNAGNKAVMRVDDQSPALYLYTSIVAPNEHLVEGFQPDLMPQNFDDLLSDAEMAHIVAYLLSLRGNE